jgi:hypothetical protein
MTTTTLKPIWAGLRWNVRLAAKMMRAAPAATVGVVVFTLISQLSKLLAFFLPLKVVILLNSNELPNELPISFTQLSSDKLIIVMSVAAALFFCFYLISNVMLKAISKQGAQNLKRHSGKIEQLSSLHNISEQTYKRQSKIIADTVFALLALIGLFIIYPYVGFVALGYLILTAGIMIVIHALSSINSDYYENKFLMRLDILGGFGFMLVFAFLVIDSLYYSPPNFVYAMLALLLSRQMFRRLPALIARLVWQYGNRPLA